MGSLCQSSKPAYPSNIFEWASSHAPQEGGGSNKVSNEVPNCCNIIEMMRYAIDLDTGRLGNAWQYGGNAGGRVRPVMAP